MKKFVLRILLGFGLCARRLALVAKFMVEHIKALHNNKEDNEDEV